MIVVIPTYGRVNNQRTYKNLPREIREKTVLVVQDREKHLYKDQGWTYTVLPPEIQDIATTRDWIIRFNNQKKILMLDDDLDFAKRRKDDPTRFERCTDVDLSWLFLHISELLELYSHVSVAGREGANRQTDQLLFNTRTMRVLGYNTDVIKALNIQFSPATFMCDFHVNLSLLRNGFQNCVVNSFVQNQPASNSEGGCSEQRTFELQREAAEWLAAEHSDFVTVVKKASGNWVGSAQDRYDVRVQWKKAYESSQKKVLSYDRR